MILPLVLAAAASSTPRRSRRSSSRSTARRSGRASSAASTRWPRCGGRRTATWPPSPRSTSSPTRRTSTRPSRASSRTSSRSTGTCYEIGRELQAAHRARRSGRMLTVDPLFAAWDPRRAPGRRPVPDQARLRGAAQLPAHHAGPSASSDGTGWTRRQWAEARLTGRFARRVPAEVQQEITAAQAAADLYIAEYNVWMHHVLVARRASGSSPRGSASSATGTCATSSRPTTPTRTGLREAARRSSR